MRLYKNKWGRSVENYSLVKHNPISVYLYNRLLDLRCKDVQAFIFVATTGRSGTDSLALVLGSIPGVAAYHEPYPVMTNDYKFVEQGHKKSYFKRLFNTKKRIYIKRAASGNRYYCETNHMFVKNYIDYAVMEFRSRLKIIHLRRDPIKVALSFYSIGSIPGVTRRGKLYLLDPLDNDNVLGYPEIARNSEEDRFLRCLWYWYEIEARIKKYKKEYSGIQWIFMETEELNKLSALRQLSVELGIPARVEDLAKVCGIRANPKTKEKKAGFPVDEAIKLHDRLVSFLSGI